MSTPSSPRLGSPSFESYPSGPESGGYRSTPRAPSGDEAAASRRGSASSAQGFASARSAYEATWGSRPSSPSPDANREALVRQCLSLLEAKRTTLSQAIKTQVRPIRSLLESATKDYNHRDGYTARHARNKVRNDNSDESGVPITGEGTTFSGSDFTPIESDDSLRGAKRAFNAKVHNATLSLRTQRSSLPTPSEVEQATISTLKRYVRVWG